jgi:hypothetical protein
MRLRPSPPLLINIIHAALQACEGVRFHPGSTCGTCGGPLSRYDERKKRFAVLVEEGKTCSVHVIIQRSACRDCGKISVPEEPFYPGTRIGSPVVDLCRSLSRVMPYSRVSTQLSRMDVVVDRWSVRHYAMTPLPDVPAMEVFGMQIPISIVSLSTFAGTVREPGHLDMEDVLIACNRPSMVARTGKRPDQESEK